MFNIVHIFPFFLLLKICLVSSVKVLSFEKAKFITDTDAVTKCVLNEESRKPVINHFVLCMSAFNMQPGAVGILGLETSSGDTIFTIDGVTDDSLWVVRDQQSEPLEDVDFGWFHVCVEAHLDKGHYWASINGHEKIRLNNKTLSFDNEDFVISIGKKQKEN